MRGVSRALLKELVKFWLDELCVLSAPKFYVATLKIISRYLRFISIFIKADLLNLRSAVSFINFIFRRLLLRRIYLKFAFKIYALNGDLQA